MMMKNVVVMMAVVVLLLGQTVHANVLCRVRENTDQCGRLMGSLENDDL
jgi:hypothetical protein